MAGSINYQYDPNQDVYLISDCENSTATAVVQGTVIRVRASVLVTETVLIYDVRVQNQSGTIEFTEADVFTDLATAIAEYQLRLTP